MQVSLVITTTENNDRKKRTTTISYIRPNSDTTKLSTLSQSLIQLTTDTYIETKLEVTSTL